MGIIICERIILFFLGLMIFFLPISKAVIEISATICIIAWFIKQSLIFFNNEKRGLLNSFKQLRLKFISFDMAVIFLIIANLLAAIYSTNISLSLNAFFLKFMEYLLIFLIAKDVISSRQRYAMFIWIISFSLLSIGLDGIFQIVTGYDLFRHRGAFSNCRITASFINPNDLGSYLITLIPLVLSLVCSNINKRMKVVLSIIAIVTVSMLLLTFSKGAIFAFILALIFFGFYTKKRYALLGLLMICLLAIILPLIFKSHLDLAKRMISFSSDGGAIDRKFLWAAAWRMFLARPIFGVGLGTFMENYQKFWLKPTVEIAYTHNCYLQTLAETGIIGLGAFIIFLFIWGSKTLITLSIRDKTFYYFTFLGLITGLVAYLLNSFVDTNFYSLPIAMLFWFILGLQVSAIKLIKNE